MQIGPREIAQRLNAQAEQVCRKLLPHGKKVGGEWQAGDLYGDDGNSLSINLNKGVGKDFANPDSYAGDMLTLWRKARGISMREAIIEAKAFLGVEEVVAHKKTYRTPDKPAAKKLRDEFSDYMTGTRMINPETLAQFKACMIRDKNEIVFPFISPDGELVAIKYLKLNRDERGRKIIRADPGCAPSFFGWQALAKDSPEVIITEGEIDAMTWHSMGFPALSVPNGASSAGEAIGYDWENLQQFETIYLCPDADRAGEEMVEQFVRRIGKARLRVIGLGEHKDANDALCKGWTSTEFREAIFQAKGLFDSRILTTAQNAQEITDYILRSNEIEEGSHIALFGPDIRLLPGHAVLLSGPTGHGKSQIVHQAAVEIAQQHQAKVAIASLEMDTLDVVRRMVELDIGIAAGEMTKEILEDYLAERDSFVWLKQTGKARLADIIDFWEYAKSRFGCTHFVLDNLTKLTTKMDDYAQQTDDMNTLTDWGRDNRVTVWVLAHHRKIPTDQAKKQIHSVDEVRGASTITDLTSVALAVYRNRRKEQSNTPDPKAPDAWIYCTKQRSTGKEPVILLWRDLSVNFVKLQPGNKIDEDDIPDTKPAGENTTGAQGTTGDSLPGYQQPHKD